MAQPSLVQVTPLVRTAGFSTARTLTFPAPVTAGNTIVVCGAVLNPGAGSVAAVTASVSMTDEVFQRKADKSLRYEAFAGLTLWVADNANGGETAVTVSPAIADANNNCALFAMEWTDTAASAFEGYTAFDSAEGVLSFALGPTPAAGNPSQVDIVGIAVSFANQGGGSSTNLGWTTPSGWTSIVAEGSPSGALRPIQAIYKKQAAQTAMSVTVNSTQPDLFGRAGILFLLRGDIGSPPAPTPPPPGPAPSPPPPAAPQAVRVEGVQAEMAGFEGVKVQVHALPTTEPIAGDYIFGNADVDFEDALDDARAVLLIPVPGGVTIETGTDVIVFGQSIDGTGGFRGGVAGVVVDL